MAISGSSWTYWTNTCLMLIKKLCFQYYKKMKITPELAEVCGIHAGDGYLRGGIKNRWELDISGHVEEKEYYDLHIKNLFEKVFRINIHCRFFPGRNTYGFVIRDKDIIKFMHDLGFPYGAKSTIVKVPDKIMNSNDSVLLSRFLRGLFDTDGSVHFRRSYGKKYTEFKKKIIIILEFSFQQFLKNCMIM
ncbi:MAG: hypothetical protein AABX86_02525 [Nanoarchaeota archaeon]